MSLLDNLEPGTKASINRKRLFLKLRYCAGQKPSAQLNSPEGVQALTRCGYVVADFNNPSLPLSSITNITQIPLKHEITGILTINKAVHQSTDLFVIKNNGNSLVIKASSLPSGGEGTIVTSTDLANSNITTFGGDIDISKNNIHVKDISAGDISCNNIRVNNIFLPATGNSQIKITNGNIDTSGNVDIQGYFNTTDEENSTSPVTGSIMTRGGVGILGNLVVGGSRSTTNDMVMGISNEGIGVGGTFGGPNYIIPIAGGTSVGEVLTWVGTGQPLAWGAGGGGGGSSQWTDVPTENPTRIYYDKQVVIGSNFALPSSSEIKLHVTGDTAITKNITAYYSDERLKTFQGKIPNAIKKINQLNGYYFVENELAKSLGYNNDKVQVGVSAQEVEKVLPEIVTQAPIDKKYKTVWYDKLTPLLIEGIKEQQQQIESQQQQIDELKSLINK